MQTFESVVEQKSEHLLVKAYHLVLRIYYLYRKKIGI